MIDLNKPPYIPLNHTKRDNKGLWRRDEGRAMCPNSIDGNYIKGKKTKNFSLDFVLAPIINPTIGLAMGPGVVTPILSTEKHIKGQKHKSAKKFLARYAG